MWFRVTKWPDYCFTTNLAWSLENTGELLEDVNDVICENTKLPKYEAARKAINAALFKGGWNSIFFKWSFLIVWCSDRFFAMPLWWNNVFVRSFHSYCDRIREPDFWGGESELLVSTLHSCVCLWFEHLSLALYLMFPFITLTFCN